MMTVDARPGFVGEYWLQPMQGFSYAAAAPEDLAHRAKTLIPGDWGLLLGLYESLKAGEMKLNRELYSLVKSTLNPEVRLLGIRLLGHTADSETRDALSSFFTHSDFDTRLAAYEASLYSCDLAMVDPLLDAMCVAKRSEKLSIMSAISHILEPEPAILYDDCDELSQEGYRKVAESMRENIDRRMGQTAAVYEGNILDLNYIASRIEALCTDPEAIEYSGTISSYFDIFEAMTGFPCVKVFDDDVEVNSYNALRIISAFRLTGKLSCFDLGKRYFFGRPILP